MSFLSKVYVPRLGVCACHWLVTAENTLKDVSRKTTSLPSADTDAVGVAPPIGRATHGDGAWASRGAARLQAINDTTRHESIGMCFLRTSGGDCDTIHGPRACGVNPTAPGGSRTAADGLGRRTQHRAHHAAAATQGLVSLSRTARRGGSANRTRSP